MKSTTIITCGINNVGDSKDPPMITTGTYTESILAISSWISERSMATRFDIVLGRNEEEVRAGLRIRENTKSANLADDEMMANLQKIMDGESTDD